MMDHKKIQKFISQATRFVIGLIVLVIVLSFFALEAEKLPQAEINDILEQEKKNFQSLAMGETVNENLPAIWPPKMNTTYPDIALLDQNGQPFSISSLQGKVVLVEFVDMSAPISQAQSGAMILGAYGGAADIDEFALPFADLLRRDEEAGIALPRPDVAIVKVIVYGMSGGQGTRDDAQNWAQHFNLDVGNGYIVAVPERDLRGRETQGLIGGYQLLDRNLNLRVDSAGDMPKHNLKLTLVPMAAKLMRN